MTARIAPQLPMALLVALAAACTGQDPECADGEVLLEGVCVVEDTDDTPVDSDTDVPLSDELSRVHVVWEVTETPNAISLSLYCDGRQVFEDGPFTAKKTYERFEDIDPGSTCEVVVSDADGGLTPAGSIRACTEIFSEWDERRVPGTRERVVGEIEVPPCVRGCPDPVAQNYDPDANYDIGSCQYVLGCTDPDALNYNRTATRDNGTCDYGGFGLIEATLFTDDYPGDTRARIVCDGLVLDERTTFPLGVREHDLSAIVDGGFDCAFLIEDTTGDRGAGGAVSVCGEEIARVPFVENPDPPSPPLISFEPYEVAVATWKQTVCSGCTNPQAPEYDPDALLDDGSCTVPDF